MKNQKSATASVIACLVFAVSLIWTTDGFSQSETSFPANSLVLRSKSSKSKLLLGEPLQVAFELTNTGEAPVQVVGGGVDVGSLKIYIAYDNGSYNEYFGRGWGRKRGAMVTLEPGKSASLGSPMILWNGKPNVSHLNEDSARRVLAGKIVTEYVFQEPGIYFLKGRSFGGPGSITQIESEPARIEVVEPTGEDLEVWKQIRGNHEIAILMQNAEVDIDDSYAKRQFISQVEQIVANHSTSLYTVYLRKNLEGFKVKDARRNAYYKQ